MIVACLAAFVLLLYGAICAVACAQQERFIFAAERLPVTYPFNFRGDFTERRIRSGDAVLHALHFTVPNPVGVVLYFHGNSGCLRQWGRVAESFTQYGYDVLMLDYRGYGKSTGRIRSEADLLADAEAAYATVAKLYPEEQIFLYGRSLGCGLAVYLASVRKPGRLLLETPYYSVVDLMRRYCPLLPPFLLRYPGRADRWIRNISCPITVFHGDKDTVVPYDSSVRLLALASLPSELITICGGQHNDLSRLSAYWEGFHRVFAGKSGKARPRKSTVK